jgi:hypothetical protein
LIFSATTQAIEQGTLRLRYAGFFLVRQFSPELAI